ncbi:WecB/TagA/CpsF family glycosyltransferase [Paucisalibacillus sp. EB02]|uniref:WecB/TagA/CpsF family glycosyltransferase n=1 Tax=Paucisalibacillus sp. EB02 TaxID=1347087 RepID=UPI0004B3C888|nr:WecB/TagA/CpsF family glycosyltransferase [Paucisalibacillus sp. EB02]
MSVNLKQARVDPIIGNSKPVTIMNINFTSLSKQELLTECLFPVLMSRSKCFIVTANPEIVMNTRDIPGYKQIVQSADIVVPDGAGIVMAAKYLKLPIQERIPGFELMLDLLEFANEQNLSCYFLGATEKTSSKFIREINKSYPNIQIAGFHHGYFKDDKMIVKQISESTPDIVFVAMGSPKQDEWITSTYGQFSKGLFMGVGGSFDVIAGEVKRAPDKWIKLNLEWLYRLLKQPFRLKRIVRSFAFLILVMVKKE